MENQKRRIRTKRLLALIIALIMAFGVSLPCTPGAFATDFGGKEVQDSGQLLTISFDPQGGAFEDDGTTETKEIALPADQIDDEDYYYNIIESTYIPALRDRPGYVFEGWYFDGKKLEAGDHIYGELIQFDAKWKGTRTADVADDVKGLFGGTLPEIKFGGVSGDLTRLSVKALENPKSTATLAADAAALNITNPDPSAAVQLDISLDAGTVDPYGVIITMPIPTALAGAPEVAAIHYGSTTEAIRCEVAGDSLSFTLEAFSPVVLMPGQAPQSATVYIENVKGGALFAFNSRDVKVLPVGENVHVTIGDTLYIMPYPMEDGKGTIQATSVRAETRAGRPIALPPPHDGTYTITITQDTIVTTTFQRVSTNDNSVSVKPGQADFSVAAGGTGTSISTALAAYRNGRVLNGATFTKSSDQGEAGFAFTLTESGALTSDDIVALGRYTIYVDVAYGGVSYENIPVALNSGSCVNIEQYIANNVRSDLLNMPGDKSIAYAKATTMETVLNNGYAAFPMYNYDNFAGVYTADGKRVASGDDAVPRDRNYYFLRHADNDGKLYSLTVPSLPGSGGSSGGGGGGRSASSGKLKFSDDSYAAGEGDGSIEVTVKRTNGTDGKVTVEYSTSDGTAKAGEDYTAVSGKLTFNAGDESKSFSVPILDDALAEEEETFKVKLHNPSGGATIETSTAEITIKDNDSANKDNDTADPGLKKRVIQLTIGQLSAIADGTTMLLDAAPFVDAANRTQVPLRFIGENLGATVDWNAASRTITIRDSDQEIVLTIGSRTALVNGAPVALDSAPVVVGNRTFVPLRFVGETLGAVVDYEGLTKRIAVTR